MAIGRDERTAQCLCERDVARVVDGDVRSEIEHAVQQTSDGHPRDRQREEIVATSNSSAGVQDITPPTVRARRTARAGTAVPIGRARTIRSARCRRPVGSRPRSSPRSVHRESRWLSRTRRSRRRSRHDRVVAVGSGEREHCQGVAGRADRVDAASWHRVELAVARHGVSFGRDRLRRRSRQHGRYRVPDATDESGVPIRP